MQFIPVYLIFIPIIISTIIYIFHNKIVNKLIFFNQFILIILSILFYEYLHKNPSNNKITIGNWNQIIGIELKNDNLSLSFIFLTIFLFFVIILYSYNKRKNDSTFYFFLLFLEGTFLALIQSNDIFNLFILLEITTLLATILIVFNKDGIALKSGLYYLLFNSTGIILFLIAVIVLYNIFGSLNIDIIKDNINLINNKSLLYFAFILLMGALSVKSAFFPVFAWLPKAHAAAPSSISALLSGLIVKSGVYLIIKFYLIFEVTTFKEYFFIIGFITGLFGIVFALSQKDIKQILAYHTISQLGIILMGISTQSEISYYGGIYHIFNHALFKSLLFLGVGLVVRTYKTKKVNEIRGLFKAMPFTSILILIGILSITGAPFFNGYISKSLIKYGTEKYSLKYYLLFLINIGTATSFIKFSQIFLGKTSKKSKLYLYENISIALLAFSCLIFGIFYKDLLNIIFNFNSNIIKINIYSFINYIITIILGGTFYVTIIKKDYLIFKKIRNSQITFELINYLLIIYVFITFILSLFIQ